MRVGVDIGGTFTDGVAVDRRGHLIGHLKVPSTSPHVEEGALAVARALGDAELEQLVHGTTVATNAIVQRRLGSTALITTEGFRDVLAIGTQLRPDLYDPFQEKPAPIVPRYLRFEAVERMAADGSVVYPLDLESVSKAARRIRAEGIGAVAIAFLFSYVNPRHERLARRILRRECPGVEVALSSDVAPLIREYPRTSTTVVNAALRPILAPYLDRLQTEAGTDVLVMQSSGGVLPAGEAGRLGHHLLASGPAGGVVAASAFAGARGIRDLVTMDMGGTSFDTCLVQGGLPTVRGEQAIGGYPVLAPALDLVTVGAGGGSLARVDPGRALRVGPESAGADPGPASYGRGGVLPTVTDANVVLGRIHPARFLGGRLALHIESAARAMHDHVAKPLDLSLEEAALAIVEVASATMGRALRVITVGRGRDPATLPLVAFGGAGPLHAARLAEELGSPTVLVPPLAGFVSAIGLLATDLRVEAAETVLRPRRRRAADERVLLGPISDLADQAATRLGTSRRRAVISVAVDCRYEGQGYELTVPLASATEAGVAAARRRFHRLHRAVFGHAAPEEPVEIVTVRVTAAVPGAGFRRAAAPPGSPALPGESRAVHDGSGVREVEVRPRSGLAPGWRGIGPLLIEEGESTTWVPAGHRCAVDELGDLEIARV